MGVVPEDTWEDTTQLHRQKEAVSGQPGLTRPCPALGIWVTLCGRTGLRILCVPLALCGPKGRGCYQTPKFSLP